MKTNETPIASFDDLLKRFWKNEKTWSMVHCTVNTKTLWRHYKHHYIVLGHKWKSDIKVTVIIHFTKVKTCTGKVSMEHYTEKDFRRDIEMGLVVLEGDKYPKTDEEFEEAYLRFEERKNEKNYSIKANNCEHLATYILTGDASSSQVTEMSFPERIFSSFCDCSVDRFGKDNSSFSSCGKGKKSGKFIDEPDISGRPGRISEEKTSRLNIA